MFEVGRKSSDVFVIAEIGMTHDGSFGLAKKLAAGAIEAGADIIKFQWHIARAETLIDAPNPPYFSTESRFEYFTRTEFSQHQFSELSKFCKDHGVLSCVSVFSDESVDGAFESGFDVLKVPSGEITNLPMLKRVADTDLPTIISSGMSNWKELDEAVAVFPDNYDLAVLQCTSLYPTPAEKVGLNIIKEIGDRYGVMSGISDHTLTSATAVASVCMGGEIIEKHFTLSKDLYGPDAKFSLDKSEFSKLVSDVKFVKASLMCDVDKNDLDDLMDMKGVFQKSIVSKKAISKGDFFTLENLCLKKPGLGLSPKHFYNLIGNKAKSDYQIDTYIKADELNCT